MTEKKGVFDSSSDPEKAPDLVSPVQKPMAIRASEYVETGFLPVTEDPRGGVRIGGGEPPGPALFLTAENLVCLEDDESGRPACIHFVQWLTEADGVSKGYDVPKQLRCFCTKLATASELMEIGEVAVFACSARSPIDVRSADLIRRFRRRQRELGEEYAQTRGEKDL